LLDNVLNQVLLVLQIPVVLLMIILSVASILGRWGFEVVDVVQVIKNVPVFGVEKRRIVKHTLILQVTHDKDWLLSIWCWILLKLGLHCLFVSSFERLWCIIISHIKILQRWTLTII